MITKVITDIEIDIHEMNVDHICIEYSDSFYEQIEAGFQSLAIDTVSPVRIQMKKALNESLNFGEF